MHLETADVSKLQWESSIIDLPVIGVCSVDSRILGI